MTAESSKARLWEDTIVLSLRDAQWLRCQELRSSQSSSERQAEPLPVVPQGLIKLDGRAESRLGDIALGAGERFFLIEVKSSKEQVRDEWFRAGMFKPKKVYARLHELIAHCNRTSATITGTDATSRLFASSLYGHFVAYWDRAFDLPSRQFSETEHAVILAPYLQAVIDSLGKDEANAPSLITQLPISRVYAARFARDATFATSRDLGRNDCGLVYKDANGKGSIGARALGLSADEFHSYVSFLCQASDGSSQDEPINAVMLSSHGSFFQVVGDTSDLALFLSERFVQREPSQPERKSHPAPQQETDTEQETEIERPSP